MRNAPIPSSAEEGIGAFIFKNTHNYFLQI